MGKWKIINILEMAKGKVKLSEFWDSGVPAELAWSAFDLKSFKVIWVIWCNCNIPEIWFSKCWFSYTYDSFSTKLFIGVPCDSPHKSYFLEFRNFKLEKIKKGLKFNIVA